MTEPAPIVTAVIEDLHALRKEKGLSHDKVAQKTGLHRTTIGQIEAGKIQPTLLTCLKIAQALDVELGALITKASGKR